MLEYVAMRYHEKLIWTKTENGIFAGAKIYLMQVNVRV
jgi:hypothetical protein